MLSPKLYSDISSYVKPEDVFYCPNGVPCLREKINQVERTKTTELSSLKEYVETQEEPLIHFLFLSNMMRMKGVFTLIEACGILAKEGIDFRCNFVGAWSDVDEQQFNEQVVAHGAEKVIAVHGKKYGDDKISFFKEADVFVHPTHADCFPLVLLEAMQFGLPIIASNEGAIGDMVSKENGCLVKVGHAGELAAKMKILLQNPEIRQKMGKLGQQRFIDEFTLTKFEDRFMNIIKQTI